MEKRRRQSAWTRRPTTSIDEEINRRLSERRMSEELTKYGLWPPDPSFDQLPALSTLATKRRNVPHTLSVPTGLKRRGSRSGNALDYQNLRSASTRAKNEMLATLSMSSWLHDNGPLRLQEISRRKSCHNGFGAMALKKKEEKRLMVAHEILQTEKNYIKALETLNEVFVEPFKNACVIPEKDFRTMFPKQLHSIKSGHVRFMKELDERLNNWKWQGVLGDIFAKLGNSYHIDFMTVYSEYANNFPKSVAIINKYSRNSHKFRKLIEKCTSDPRCERLNLSAFLLTPIQRLPRYVLLLRQLSKYTDPNHPDSFHIEISLEKMIGIINLLNSSIQNSPGISRNTSLRRSSRRRKRNIFKARETMNHESISPRKSSDESETSEFSGRSTPCTKDLTLDLSSADQQNKSSDYGSMTNSEATSEPTSPSPSSGSSSKSGFLKVILRNSSDSKKNKRRPLSTTEVEIFRRKDVHLSDGIPKHDELTRSRSRDSFGSIIRHKFGSFRRKHESLPRNLSSERLNDCKERLNKSDSDFLEEHNKRETYISETLNSASSAESCNGSHEHLSVPHAHSDSDDSTSRSDSRPSSRRDFNGNDSSFIQRRNSNNYDENSSFTDQRPMTGGEKKHGDKNNTHEERTPYRKLSKRNSFTNVMKHLFVPKRSSSNSPERMKYAETMSQNTEQLLNSKIPKVKMSTV